VDFLLDSIRKNPGEITLVAIGPLTNIGAAIDRDAATFKKLKTCGLDGRLDPQGLRRSRIHARTVAQNRSTNIYSGRGCPRKKLFTSGVRNLHDAARLYATET